MNAPRTARFMVVAGDPSVPHLMTRKCRKCAQPATHVEEETILVTTISRNGRVLTNDQKHHTYWCLHHSGSPA